MDTFLISVLVLFVMVETTVCQKCYACVDALGVNKACSPDTFDASATGVLKMPCDMDSSKCFETRSEIEGTGAVTYTRGCIHNSGCDQTGFNCCTGNLCNAASGMTFDLVVVIMSIFSALFGVFHNYMY